MRTTVPARKLLTLDQLKPGNQIIFTTGHNGPLTIDRVDTMYVYFVAPDPATAAYTRPHRQYEALPFTLTNAVLWNPDSEPWSLAAGKLDDGAVNWKYIHSYPSLDQLLADYQWVHTYPVIEITYRSPVGERLTIELPPHWIVGE